MNLVITESVGITPPPLHNRLVHVTSQIEKEMTPLCFGLIRIVPKIKTKEANNELLCR